MAAARIDYAVDLTRQEVEPPSVSVQKHKARAMETPSPNSLSSGVPLSHEKSIR